jgi:hypothetical protein
MELTQYNGYGELGDPEEGAPHAPCLFAGESVQ